MAVSKIFVMTRIDGQWTAPEPLPAPINTPGGREHCPSLLQDGKTLCFASLRADGFGKSDIYCSRLLADGTYSPAVNAGPNVNTAEDEYHFTQGEDGWIHFVSFGHEPKRNADADIWYTRADGEGGFIEAVNAGAAVNAGGVFDVCPSMHPSGRMGFFSLVHNNAVTHTDLFWVD